MSIVPGEPSPTAAISSQASPLASTASRPASASVATPASGPPGRVRLDADRRERRPRVVDDPALDVRPAEVDPQEEGGRPAQHS